RPVDPGLEHGPDPARGQRGERGVVVGGEADHLAAAEGFGQRGEAVLEHHHVVVVRRYLGGPTRPRRVERALVGRGQEGPVLARPAITTHSPASRSQRIPQSGRPYGGCGPGIRGGSGRVSATWSRPSPGSSSK